MSDYDDLISVLRKKAGPLTLEEIQELLENNELPAGWAGPSSVARSVADKLAETVSVKDYGAVGDGVTDDGPAFTAAIAYANGLSSSDAAYNGVVSVPAGEYRVATSILMKSRVKVVGYGATLVGPITGYGRIDSGTSVPTSSDVDGQTAGACFTNSLTSETIVDPCLEGLEFSGFRFGICTRAFAWAYAQGINLSFYNCDICIFNYQGSQFWHLASPMASSCHSLFVGAATCFATDNALKNDNNAFCDGTKIIGSRRQLHCTYDGDVDDWFEDAILRPATTSIVSGFSGTYALTGVATANKVSGRPVFIPQRNSRLTYGFTARDIWMNGCPRGLGLIANPNGVRIERVQGEQMFNDATANASATESMVVVSANASIVSGTFSQIDAVHTTPNVNVKGVIDVIEPASFTLGALEAENVQGEITGRSHFVRISQQDASGYPRQMLRSPALMGRRATTVTDAGTATLHKVNGATVKFLDDAFTAHRWLAHGSGRLPISAATNETNARIMVDGRANQVDGSFVPLHGIIDLAVRRLDTGVMETGRYAIAIGGRNSSTTLNGAVSTSGTSITLASDLAAIGPGAIVTIGGSDRYLIQSATTGSAVRGLAQPLRDNYSSGAAVVCVFEIATITAVAGTICTVTADAANSCIKITNSIGPVPIEYWFEIRSFGTPL